MAGGCRQRGRQEPGRAGDVEVLPEWLPVAGNMAVWSDQNRSLPADLVGRGELGRGNRRDRQWDLSDLPVPPPAPAGPGERRTASGDERGRGVPDTPRRSGEQGEAVTEEVQGGAAG